MVDSYTKLEEGRRCKISSSYSGQWMVCNLLIYLFMGFSICYFLGVTEPPERETAGKWGLLNADVTKCLAPVWLTSITLFFFLWWELKSNSSNFHIAYSHIDYIYHVVHYILQFSSVQFSRSVVSNSLWPHEPQHARPPCPSPTPRVHSDSRPSSPWCHPAISSSVVPFSSCPQSLPASKSFPMSQLFTWGGQSTGVSALASFLPKK